MRQKNAVAFAQALDNIFDLYVKCKLRVIHILKLIKFLL